MRTYEVYYNANRKFQPAEYQVIGTVLANNKNEAVREVKAALYGKSNSATIYIQEVPATKNLKSRIA